jgi:hypothetical protein
MTPGRLKAIESYWLRNGELGTGVTAARHVAELIAEIRRCGGATDPDPTSPPDFIQTRPPLVRLGQGDYARDINERDLR